MIRLALVLGLSTLSLSAVQAAMAPTRCHPAKGAVAATICASSEYLAMDREIGALTDRGMARFTALDRKKLAQSELRYFRLRQGCSWAAHNSAHPGTAVEECIRAKMEGRLNSLRTLVDRGGF